MREKLEKILNVEEKKYFLEKIDENENILEVDHDVLLMLACMSQSKMTKWFFDYHFDFEKAEWKYEYNEMLKKIKRYSNEEIRLIMLGMYFFECFKIQEAFRESFTEKVELLDYIFEYNFEKHDIFFKKIKKFL